ncbi:MAG TPA: alpha-amylase family glycosyl hydrolase [Acidimicrobiales bacterium]|nr:alpha-amylase family glycosyl hydrolase [Acidimicrobiales bacterium]
MEPEDGTPPSGDPPWWQRGLLYQIYPRSFADSDADGIGDLPGITAHLDHLEWLGVDGIWLSPVTVSPNRDWGYDVADYLRVDPALGTDADLDHLIDAADRRGIRVLLDLVPNHTSDEHPWFVDARRSRQSLHRQWYVWADPAPGGGPPNNWVSSFVGGPAWTFDEPTGQYYLHNHLPEQPDLNWWNDGVRRAFDDILTTWFGRGVAGFRIDVCSGIVKDAELRDNPPSDETDPFIDQVFGQRPVYNGNRPEVHDVLRHWRRLADDAGGRLLLGETPVALESMVTFYGSGGDELHLAFNFPFIEGPLEASAMRALVEDTERLLPPGGWPVWTGSNHDVSRLATRWAEGDERKTRVALLVLLCLRGTPVLYQGDEIGLPDVPVPQERLRDPVGVRYWPLYAGRDPMRTPMPWRPGPGGGFTEPGVEPWLPFGHPDGVTVAEERDDRGSVLNFVRDLVALRRRRPELSGGSHRTMATDPPVWAWARGEQTVVACNMGDAPNHVGGVRGTVLAGTRRDREGEGLSGRIDLDGWEAVVVDIASP